MQCLKRKQAQKDDSVAAASAPPRTMSAGYVKVHTQKVFEVLRGRGATQDVVGGQGKSGRAYVHG